MDLITPQNGLGWEVVVADGEKPRFAHHQALITVEAENYPQSPIHPQQASLLLPSRDLHTNGDSFRS